MPALPLDKLQLTERDPKTGKLRTLPALVSSVFPESQTRPVINNSLSHSTGISPSTCIL
uniref:Uncharacterized protein n=1 Tax=Buteo japonicus TaxID=224669 RepID=A0A8C0B987_9AVES